MQCARRAGVRSMRRSRPQPQRQQQRFESHGPNHDSHGHHAAPVNESFGSGFFAGLLVIPAAIAIYTISRPDANGEDKYFTRLIKETYADYAQKWEDRNDLHTRMIEQAAADRTLFLHGRGQVNRHIDLKFPEIFNTGSPYNVPAGHGSANMDALIQKYQKESFEENERKLQQLRENKVPVEQPLKVTMTKSTPGVKDS